MPILKSPKDPVSDDEILYRRINLKLGVTNKDGKYHLSASAFNDDKFQPSVDRALFKNNDPEKSKVKSTDGIASLIAGEIRSLDVTTDNGNFSLDVVPAPSKKNQSHALITHSPEYKNRSNFRKIQERLSRLAAVEIPPT